LRAGIEVASEDRGCGATPPLERWSGTRESGMSMWQKGHLYTLVAIKEMDNA